MKKYASVTIATKHWSSKLSLSGRPNFKVHEQFNANLFKFKSAKLKNVKQTIAQIFLKIYGISGFFGLQASYTRIPRHLLHYI